MRQYLVCAFSQYSSLLATSQRRRGVVRMGCRHEPDDKGNRGQHCQQDPG